MAPYQRNLPSTTEVTIDLPAGDHEVEVWLGDLCERDTRFWFRLTAEGAEACVLPVPVAPERVTAIEALLDGMHMTRPAFPDGMVTVRFAEPAPFALRAEIGVEGHFMSADAAGLARTIEAGASELPLADVAELPADFRYFDIALTRRHARNRADDPGAPPRRRGGRCGGAGHGARDARRPGRRGAGACRHRLGGRPDGRAGAPGDRARRT